jgi:hypothetical protein
MNNVALLSMSTDGRITPEAWALAAARDRAEQVAAVRVMLPRIGKVTLKPEVIIRIMAKVIRQAAPARAAVHLRISNRPASVRRTRSVTSRKRWLERARSMRRSTMQWRWREQQSRLRPQARSNAGPSLPLAGLHEASAAGDVGLQGALVQTAQSLARSHMGDVSARAGDRWQTVGGISRGGACGARLDRATDTDAAFIASLTLPSFESCLLRGRRR